MRTCQESEDLVDDEFGAWAPDHSEGTTHRSEGILWYPILVEFSLTPEQKKDNRNSSCAHLYKIIDLIINLRLVRALFAHQDAQLGELEGTGYLFQNKETHPASYQGVFFGSNDKAESIESLVDEDPVSFKGVMYKKNRAGQIKGTKVEMTVDVTQFREVSMGARALLEVVQEDD